MVEESNPPIYVIRLKERLSIDQQHWFDEMQLINDMDGQTLLTGPVIDQAALYGLLNRISILGLTLISINRIRLNSQSDHAES